MIRINQITMPVGHKEAELYRKCCRLLKLSEKEVRDFQIVKQSVDARKKPDIFYSYVVDLACDREEQVLKQSRCRQAELIKPERYRFPASGEKRLEKPILIIGMGPAGLFCAYMLAKHGYKPVILERGQDVDSRSEAVNRFWETGVLDTHSNVQFGEGGAGTFSDGKLNTMVKDREGRNRAVLSVFVQNGAPESILYEAKPHIGTDVLKKVVKNMRSRIIEWGGEVHFESQAVSFQADENGIRSVTTQDGTCYPCEAAVLAIGHSARDTFETLYEMGVPMEAKAFAVGFRVEHPQALINVSQYGTETHPVLSAAPYKVAAKTSSGRGVYSFCMCPGGYVVNASSEEGHTAVNGMSYSDRKGKNANSAIIVSVTPQDFGSGHPLAGIGFQRALEKKAYALGQGKVPVEHYGDFHYEVTGRPVERHLEYFEPQIKGKWQEAKLSELLPEEMNRAFIEGMEHFDKILPGFASDQVWLDGIESRTSSPVRILRDEAFQSAGLKGLYPCGEGAGYAGGITSAAMDGLRVAERIAGKYGPVKSEKEE